MEGDGIMDKKHFSIAFVALFVILTWYLWQNNDYIANLIANDGLQGLLWYFVSNANYVLLLITIGVINRERGIGKNLLGGLMLIYSFDIVSFPRLSPAGLTQDIGLLASSDGLVVSEFMKFGLTYPVAYNIYYLILPIVLVLASLAILGIANFFNKITGHHQ